MKRNVLLWIGLALSVVTGSCGPSEGKYQQEITPALCAKQAECVPDFDEQACLDAETGEPDDTCTYNKKAARTCLKEIEDTQCGTEAEGFAPNIPSACDEVYDCADGENSDNSGNTNNMSANDQCQTDEDCPDASDATFARPDEAICADGFMGKYCSECVNDQQCEKGEACRDATYCEALPPCEVGQDCADDSSSEVHQACISKSCDFCIDDADCEDDEVCYSRLCATRSTVDPTCIDASCEGACEIQYDDNGAATGVQCL